MSDLPVRIIDPRVTVRLGTRGFWFWGGDIDIHEYKWYNSNDKINYYQERIIE